MSDCCEIVDISQESPTEDDLFNPEKGLLCPEKGLFTPENSLLTPENSLLIPESELFSPEKGLLSPENGLFVPEKGFFTSETVNLNPEKGSFSANLNQHKVPRPPNAFMLYANEHRKPMAHLYPADSNKDISKRLGTGWKTLSSLEKHKYFQRAKAIDSEHKKKYPDYVYNPKEARIRKAMREATKTYVGIPTGNSPTRNVPRGGPRKIQFMTKQEQQNLIMPNPLTQLQQNGFFSNYSDLRVTPSNLEIGRNNHQDQPEYISQGEVVILTSENQNCDTAIVNNTNSDFEKRKTSSEIQEDNQLNSLPNIYLPLSCTKFSASPDLFTNSAQYHKEYIAKYFQSIPDYEILNVTTEDGGSFPYVTIPKLRFRQNILEKSTPQNKV